MDKHRLTQVGRAMKELGVQMIAAYSPQARGRSERSFGTWQGRLPQELRLAEITTVEEANQFLRDHYIARVQREVQSGGGGERHGVSADQPDGSGLDLHDPDREGGGERQHSGYRGALVADRIRRASGIPWRGPRSPFMSIWMETVSIRYGPHVVGRFDATGES